MDRKARPKYEMNNLRNPSSTASLLEPESAWKTRSETPQQSSKFHDFLRHVRLLLPITLFSHCVGWRSPKEQPKVAAYKSRRMAALNSLLHSIPLGGASVLVVLYWRKTWVGGATDNATALQFAAKVLELAMQASLVDIFLYLIRSQALNSYIPLGALSGAAQAPRLSYLWSLDFISAIRSPSLDICHRTIFALSLIVLLCMTAVVGPSAAVLLIPRPGMPHLNNTIFHSTNASEASLYPSDVDEYFNLDLSGSRNMLFWNTIGLYSMPHDYYITTSMDPDAILVNKVGYILSHDHDKDNSAERQVAVATVAAEQSTAVLFWESPVNGSIPADNITMVMQAPQPIVFSSCWHGSLADSVGFYFSNDGSQKSFSNPRILYEELVLGNVTIENSDRDYFPPLWIRVPEDSQSLLAIVPRDPVLALCTVSSFWWTATTSYSTVNGQDLVRPEMPNHFEAMTKEKLRPITINPKVLSVPNASCVHNTTALTPIWLAGCFGAALSALPFVDSDNEGKMHLYLSNGSDLFQLNGSAPYLTFQIDVSKYGYGYGSTNILTTLAVTVMTAYCLITILYVCYIVTTGHTSIAWNSPTELIMLALQSKDPGDLGHVSVGLNSMEIFRKSVGIRVNTIRDDDTGETKERLELVFEHDEDTEKRGLTKVVRNRAY